MSRKRTKIGHAADAEIKARTARGESAETIFEAIGRVISTPTIRRRQAELRSNAPKADAGTPRSAPARPAGSGIPPKGRLPDEATDDVPEEVPADASATDLDRWITRLEKGATKAEAQGNLAALASIAAKVTALMALRHRSAPLPKADPNENPDMKALAAVGRERLRKLANGLFTPT